MVVTQVLSSHFQHENNCALHLSARNSKETSDGSTRKAPQAISLGKFGMGGLKTSNKIAHIATTYLQLIKMVISFRR